MLCYFWVTFTTLWVFSCSDKNIQSADLDWGCRKTVNLPWGFKRRDFYVHMGGLHGVWSPCQQYWILYRILQIYGSFTRFVEYNRKVRSKLNKIYVTCRGNFFFLFSCKFIGKEISFFLFVFLFKYIMPFQFDRYV